MLLRRIRYWLNSGKREAELRAEIESHIQEKASELRERGLADADAMAEARRRFGNVLLKREESREVWIARNWMDLLQDLRYGARALARRKSFTLAAAGSLALGIGLNTLIFSIVNSTLLKPMGHRNAGRIAVIWTTPAKHPDQTGTSSVSTYFGLRDQARSFESIGAFNGGGCGVKTLGAGRDGAPAERLFGQCFSPSMFGVLGIEPLMGRTFTEAEDQVGNVAHVVLISHGLWQRRFGSDPKIVGKAIDLNLVPTTVIGVLPPNFELFKDPNAEATRSAEVDFVLPLELTPTQVQSRVGGLTIVGRLQRGISIRQAQTEIDTISAGLASADAERHQDLAARVDSLDRAAYRDYRSPLFLLEGAVLFVLLISCANVSGLLLARAGARRHEIALRTALGAGRSRILRQLIIENMPLALIGGVGGFVLAAAGLRVFIAAAPRDFPRLDQISMDARVLIVAAASVLLTGFVSAIIPAVQASRATASDRVRDSTRTTAGRERLRMRSLLVTGQIAVALVLLIASGLMVRSFIRVLEKNLGADPTNLLTFDFRLTQAETVTPAGRYRGLGLWNISPAPAQRVERVLERLQSLRGVLGTAAVNTAPFRNQTMSMPFVVEGRPAPPPNQAPTASYFAVTRGFFAVMRTPLVRGRDFDEHDNADSTHVIIINETMARRFFPNEDPIGKRLTLDWTPGERPWEIVGVVSDMAMTPLEQQQGSAVYVPHLQQPSQFTGPYWYLRSGMYFVIRTAADPMALLPAVKAAVSEVDRNTPVADARTAGETIENQLRNLRLYMLLLSVFGIAAAALAAAGIYGVMAYAVAERTREIGIRMALGGRAADILKMVFTHAAAIIGIGLGAGLVSSLALMRLIRSSLFDITGTDPATYAVVSLLLVFVGVMACLLPARRAAAVDPMIALKHE